MKAATSIRIIFYKTNISHKTQGVNKNDDKVRQENVKYQPIVNVCVPPASSRTPSGR